MLRRSSNARVIFLAGFGVLLTLIELSACRTEVAVEHRNGPPEADAEASGVRGREDENGVEPGPWFVVDVAEAERLQPGAMYHQGPRPPVPVRRSPVVLPLPPTRIPERPLVVQVILNDRGRVARARLLRAPPLPGIGTELLRDRLAEALGKFLFEPATLDGEAVAVYYSLTVELAAKSGNEGANRDSPQEQATDQGLRTSTEALTRPAEARKSGPKPPQYS